MLEDYQGEREPRLEKEGIQQSLRSAKNSPSFPYDYQELDLVK